LRWFAGRLTAHLNGVGQARAWDKSMMRFLITYKVQTELMRIILSNSKMEANNISHHAAKFEEKAINITAARSQIRSV
jgi:hypothetical protein